MLKADFHLHVKGDPQDPIKHTAKQLIDLAAKKGFQVLSITCHDYVYYSTELAHYAKSKGILLIPGAEKTLYGKHVLLYNITNEDLKKINSFHDIHQLKKQKPNLLVIAPHPYFYIYLCLGHILEKNINLFDAVEYSHFYTYLINANKKAVKIARKYSKPLIGNSDTHHFFQFGTTFSYIDSKKDISSVISAIKSNRVKLSTAPLPIAKFLRVAFWAVSSLLLRKLGLLHNLYK